MNPNVQYLATLIRLMHTVEKSLFNTNANGCTTGSIVDTRYPFEVLDVFLYCLPIWDICGIVTINAQHAPSPTNSSRAHLFPSVESVWYVGSLVVHIWQAEELTSSSSYSMVVFSKTLSDWVSEWVTWPCSYTRSSRRSATTAAEGTDTPISKRAPVSSTGTHQKTTIKKRA